MSNLSLLRVMITKEVRSSFRERSQIMGLLLGVLMPIIAMGGMFYQTAHSAHRRGAHPSPDGLARALGLPPNLLVWVAIGAPALIGFFFSMSYLLSGVLASFVGEKEAKTLEILLASPLSDRKLYFTKCISVLLPSATIGYVFAISATVLALAFVPMETVVLPATLLPYALILSVPVMILPQIWLVGLGAAISAKAETMKGAGQVLGAVFMIPFFGCIYGVPALLQANPGLRQALADLLRSALGLPFIAEYALVLGVLATPAVILMGIGRFFFRRDRMLT
jgi:ABC-type Na+ efflux pump permease subunit